MAVKLQLELEAQAIEIRDETEKWANTEFRVGTHLLDTVQTMFGNLGLKVDKVAGYGLSENDFTDTLKTKLDGIEDNATADQTASEIEIAYNSQVPEVSQAEAEAGIETTVRRWSPLRVAQAILKLAGVVKRNLTAIADPGVNDDSTQGYAVGSVWLNTSTDEYYRCVDPSAGAAVWVKTTLTADELATIAISGDYNDLINKPSFEPPLGNPASDGYVLSSTAAGVRSWVAQSGGTPSYLRQGSLNFNTPALGPDSNFQAGIGFSQPAAGEWETILYGHDGVTTNEGLRIDKDGQLLSNPDADATTILGRARIDSRSSNTAYFSHYDLTGAGDYAFGQTKGGVTLFNAKAGQYIAFRINNVNKWFISDGTLQGATNQVIKLVGNSYDPPTTDGTLLYNTTLNKFRAKENGELIDVISTPEVVTSFYTDVSSSGSHSETFSSAFENSFPNSTAVTVELHITGVKSDGSATVTAYRKGTFLKNSSGTWSIDWQGTFETSDSAIIASGGLYVSTNPGITYTMGASSGDWRVTTKVLVIESVSL